MRRREAADAAAAAPTGDTVGALGVRVAGGGLVCEVAAAAVVVGDRGRIVAVASSVLLVWLALPALLMDAASARVSDADADDEDDDGETALF